MGEFEASSSASGTKSTPSNNSNQAVLEQSSTATLKLTTVVPEQVGENESNNQAEAVVAHSLKCDDCNKLLKDEDHATLHAHKTGHINFSESTESIKPKTKEEIEEQKKRLAEKLVRIRQEKQEKERQEAVESEKLRRKEGRQLNEIKQKFHEEELKRIAAEKRREKLEDIAYKYLFN
jgi:UBX domain-containing protein 1/4